MHVSPELADVGCKSLLLHLLFRELLEHILTSKHKGATFTGGRWSPHTHASDAIEIATNRHQESFM